MTNLIVRDARLEDYDFFARMFAELRVPDPTPTRGQFDTRIRPHSFLLWEDARPVAYAFWFPLGDVARVNHVVVDPIERGRGVGAALMRELVTRAKCAGCTRWTLHVKPDNVRAIRLYERFGMQAVARSTAMWIAWGDVARLPRDEGTAAFLVAPEDEGRVEAAAGLLPGQIGGLRAIGGRVFLALRQGEEIVAFAAFDPSFPGAMPFFAARPAIARAMLEAMRPYALSEHSFVRLVVEHGVVLSAMTAAGAEAVLEMLRMQGPIGG